MKTPTSIAPHIWYQVRRNISPNWAAFSLPMAMSSSATMIHEARMALPPMYGAKLNTAVTLPFSGQLAASEEHPATCALNQLTFGSGDHGPVQRATTTSSTANGSQACTTSVGVSPCPRVCLAVVGSTATPPYPSTVFGCHTFNSSNSAMKQTIEPVMSGRYGPRYTAVGYWPAI